MKLSYPIVGGILAALMLTGCDAAKEAVTETVKAEVQAVVDEQKEQFVGDNQELLDQAAKSLEAANDIANAAKDASGDMEAAGAAIVNNLVQKAAQAASSKGAEYIEQGTAALEEQTQKLEEISANR